MIKCTYCGQGNADNTQFCRFCGNRLTLAEPQHEPTADFRQAAPRPYAWKTDEYQTQSEPRQTRPIQTPVEFGSPDENFRPSALAYQQPQAFVQTPVTGANKSRVGYILLGVFLGGLGIHNFYAGYTGKGVAQLLLNLLLFWTIIVPVGVWIWTLVEIVTVDRDADGNRLV